MNILILKTPFGDIIGNVTKKDNEYEVKKAYGISFQPGEKEMTANFHALAHFAADMNPDRPYLDIDIHIVNVLFSYKASESIVEGYTDATNDSKILKPNNKIIT